MDVHDFGRCSICLQSCNEYGDCGLCFLGVSNVFCFVLP